jgi:hypothetical protein
MKTITALLNLPDALQWLNNRQEIFSVLYLGFAAPPKNQIPVILFSRIN